MSLRAKRRSDLIIASEAKQSLIVLSRVIARGEATKQSLEIATQSFGLLAMTYLVEIATRPSDTRNDELGIEA